MFAKYRNLFSKFPINDIYFFSPLPLFGEICIAVAMQNLTHLLN